MEFTRLADVDVVETANDTDKVLIEQNGEIKRVPKTEVGGSGGNTLVLNIAVNTSTFEVTLVSSNMTLDEALTAMNNCELAGGLAILDVDGQRTFSMMLAFADQTAQVGSAAFVTEVFFEGNNLPFRWTADGIMVVE